MLRRARAKPLAMGHAAQLLRTMAVVLAVLSAGSAWESVHARALTAQAPSAIKPSTESSILPTDVPIHMSAERLSFNYRTNTYTARGNVTVSQHNTRLRADSIVYEGNSGTLIAEGKVIVRAGSDVVEAGRVVIQLAAGTGVLFNGKLFLTRHNVFLEGKELEKTGESTYRIKEGSFTTCNGATPDWRITGKDLDVTLEGYGTLKHGFFYIKDIPVFYMPWLIYPAKRQRQTGFLMPTIANSSVRGFDMRLPFFINISPSIDATLIPRICTKRAAQAAVEFRYHPYEDLNGVFYAEYTYDWKYRPEKELKEDRFYIALRHDQEFSGGLKLKGNGSWVSDRDYFEYWGTRFDRRLRFRYLESNGVMYRQWDNFMFQAEVRHFDNLDLPDNAYTVQNLPIITGTLFNQQVPYTPFYLSSNMAFNNYYAPIMHKQWFGSRLIADTRLSMPLGLGRFLKMEPSMTYFAKAYRADYCERDRSVSSVTAVRTDLYQVNADVFTDLEAVYEGGITGFQRIKHTVRPQVGWTFRPFTSHQTYPYFDETDRMDRANLLTAEIRHTLTGRVAAGEYLDFLALSVSQTYDLQEALANNKQASIRTAGSSPWKRTQAELVLKPMSIVDVSAQAEYDPVMNRARRYSVHMGLMDHRGDLVRVLHHFTEDEKNEDLNRQTNVNLQVKLTSSLDCFFENQYTHQFKFSYYTSFGVNYHPQCWNVILRYSEAREQDPLTGRIKDPDQTVFATLSLYGLGQIYQFSRDWAEILGHVAEGPKSAIQ